MEVVVSELNQETSVFDKLIYTVPDTKIKVMFYC